ncbi:Nodule Cysteine-Rich (NCR) secreted peptide [Medicago truncatula]|uniref:Nodule Cysteine-Rich (NCR) secreted peptide n=1 Tax=Medicago truncatula TaxID=3880 RepID=A0A072U1G7_MEDTR|nr:Nodule Cysteine-Rich (NCR) secreted peptide [Medicago truncatula]
MAEILKFVYTMILFVSIFIIVVNVGGKCVSDAECSGQYMCPTLTVIKCIKDECVCIHYDHDKQ